MTPNTADDLGMRLEDDDVAVPVTEFRALPAGTYPVEFINYEKLQTQFGESLKLLYRVTHGPEADAQLDEIASLKGGRGAKLKLRMGALRGRPYAPGETIRPRELFGRQAQAYVTVKKIKDDDGTEFEVNRIGDLTAAPSRPTPKGASPAAASADDPGWDTMQPPPAEEEAGE
jgi:hypothetical protein